MSEQTDTKVQNNPQLQEFRQDFALMIEAGFIAVKQLDEVSATRIFYAAQAMNHFSTAPRIGLGYIALNRLEIKKATRIFESVVNEEPDNYLAQVFLGICFLLTKGKMPKGEKLIKETLTKTKDATITNLGTLSLEWAEKDLKKIKAPFFIGGKQEDEQVEKK